jgi:hypothetical protein
MEKGREEDRTLADVMPTEFVRGEHDTTKAYKMRDEVVIEENSRFIDQDEYIRWPGKHKNVHLWVKLSNGYAIGWNENPSRGWSFPVIKL